MKAKKSLESAALIAVSLLITACGRAPRTAAQWEQIDMEAADAHQLARAVEARDAFASRLMGKLTGAIAEGGPGNAVGICNTEAPLIAEGINEEFGVRIGRTSHKLRNPNNTPPSWMSTSVSEIREEPAAFTGPGGVLGAVYPIRVAAPCLLCHGDPGAIIPEARSRIAELYPDDRATGFAAGDLRGWFWIEVPSE